jgi:hypothetical protein
MFFLRHHVLTGSGAHSASYEMGSFSGVKLPGRETNHSPPSNAEVKNTWSYISASSCVFIAWCFVKYSVCPHGVVLS